MNERAVVNRADAEDCPACMAACDADPQRSGCDYHEGVMDGMGYMSRLMVMAAQEPEIVAHVEWERRRRELQREQERRRSS
jgi:hypothetical protein